MLPRGHPKVAHLPLVNNQAENFQGAGELGTTQIAVFGVGAVLLASLIGFVAQS